MGAAELAADQATPDQARHTSNSAMASARDAKLEAKYDAAKERHL
jgi:hypothetical protein